MNIISLVPSENGAYNGLQTWDELVVPTGYAQWPDDLETETLYSYNGFVNLVVKRNIVTSYEPNLTAWEAWKSTVPSDPEDPKPSDVESQIDTLELQTDELYEALDMILTGATK